ncbi:MAG: 4-(cytidine 5'-diphospho)-2-C-methyl-D-erythritol kinase [Cyanobacteria bacterium QS_8_64_29]|nr:MAG: 4-(cytidine 5'-diphospho)-2-C-methyl-D-erythritol kinase [Cyanobacteria bacterium QS_8_64_29]
MRSYSLLAPAKINLHLEILGDRADGYHELVMVLQSLDLADRIELSPNRTDAIRVSGNAERLPPERDNLAYQAAQLMAQQFPQAYAQHGGVTITIDKRIPIAAGMAGGSSDAAAVLVGLDLMWQLGLTQPELQNLAAQLGSDLPFCVAGGTALATGRGEQLEALAGPHRLAVVIAKHRNLSVSTAWAYCRYRERFGNEYCRNPQDARARAQRVHSGALVSAIAQQDGAQIGQRLHNDFERIVLDEFPQVAQLRDAFERQATLGSLISGSGPAVFALCESLEEAARVRQAVADELADPELEFWTSQLSSAGIQLADPAARSR